MAPRGRREGDRAVLEMLRARMAEAERAKAPKDPAKAPKDPAKAPKDPAKAPKEHVKAPKEHVKAPKDRPAGLEARTLRGPTGATWWSRRFLGSLESAMAGGRMARGRAYARSGRVARLVINPGVVVATVQGSREEPYAVRLEMPVVPAEDWDRILEALATRAQYAARMLAGELPEDVEQVFEAEGASLLPAPHARLVSECTCAGWENPCPHVAAVCYLLAEELDRDPFSLLAWRGRGKAEVLGELRTRRRRLAAALLVQGPPTGDGVVNVPPGATSSPDGTPGGSGATQSDLDGHHAVDRFWVAGPELAHVCACPEEAAVPAAALRLAPRGMISARGRDLDDVLVPAYHVIVAAAAARSRR
jgi:uncharacterized Zn finger protein